MKKYFAEVFLTGLLSLVCAASNPSSVHPGLKSAIDKNDIKTAANLVKKMGVGDIYCPATMAPKDFKVIYADAHSKAFAKPDVAGFLDDCDSVFTQNMIAYSCQQDNESDATLCAAYLDKWKERDEYADSFCKSKKTRVACEAYLKTAAYENKFEKIVPLFDRIEKNGLLNPITETRTYMEDVYKDRPLTTNECLQRATTRYNELLGTCDQSYSFNISGHVRVDLAEATRNRCYRRSQEDFSKEQKKCYTKPGTIRQFVKREEKTAKVSVPALQAAFYYIEHPFRQFERDKYGWYKIGDNEKALAKFLQKADKKNPGQNVIVPDTVIVEGLLSIYQRVGDFYYSDLLAKCILYPSLDKNFEKKTGMAFFNCKDVVKNYDSNCSEEGVQKSFSLTINNADSAIYICSNGRYRLASVEERLGECNESNQGSLVYNVNYQRRWGEDSIFVHVCDKAIWRPAGKQEKENGLCGKENLYSISKDSSCVCDTAGWRELDRIEKFGGVCTAKKNKTFTKDYYDRSYVCENNVWREATDIERTYGYCDSTKFEKVFGEGDDYGGAYVCESQGWRHASDAERVGGFCNSSIKDSVVKTRNRVYYVCDSIWREAAATEAEGGVCNERNQGKTIALSQDYFICNKNEWKSISKAEYIMGYCTKEKEGKIAYENRDAIAVCRNGAWEKPSEYEMFLGECGPSNYGNLEITDYEVAVCSRKTKKWRDPNITEYVLGKSCESDEKKMTIDGMTFECEGDAWVTRFTDSRDDNRYVVAPLSKENGRIMVSFLQNLNYKKFFATKSDDKTYFLYDSKDAGKVCPEGWQLPKKYEFEENLWLDSFNNLKTGGCREISNGNNWSCVDNTVHAVRCVKFIKEK